jgi:hypothetical protein
MSRSALRCPCCRSTATVVAGWGHECTDCHRWWMTEADDAAFRAAMAQRGEA